MQRYRVEHTRPLGKAPACYHFRVAGVQESQAAYTAAPRPGLWLQAPV